MAIKAFTIFSLILFTALNLSAQSENRNPLYMKFSQNQNALSDDTVTTEIKIVKNYWLAAAEVVGLKLSLNGFGNINANYKRYWIHTLSGAESEEFVGLLNTGIGINLSANSELGFNVLLYERYGKYKFFPDTQTYNTAVRLFIKQKI